MGQAWADKAPAPSPRVSHCPLIPCACVALRARLLFIKADLSPSRSCGSVLHPPPSLIHDGLSVCPAVLTHMNTFSSHHTQAQDGWATSLAVKGKVVHREPQRRLAPRREPPTSFPLTPGTPGPQFQGTIT